MNKWFYVMDMHSGGGCKTEYEKYFIEANDRDEARRIFEDATGEDIDAIACECCGPNFCLSDEYDTLEDCAFGFNRYQSVEEYLKSSEVKVIRKEEK